MIFMLDLTLQHLAKLLGARYQGKINIIPQGVAIDSRKVKKGDLFFALKGEKTDGHKFIENALDNGAVGAVISDFSVIANPEDKNLLICEDPLRFLQDLAKLIRQNIQIPVIAITGSTGKTTTKDLVFSILEQKYNTVKTEGNYNNELGLPLTLCSINKNHEALVLEMGMRGLGQIAFLCNLAQPTHGIITNIGQVHAELLGSQEKIAQAKAELLEFLAPEGTVFLNIQDKELLQPWLEKCQATIKWYGLDEKVDIWASKVEYLGEEGTKFTVNVDNEMVEIKLNIPGQHNVLNALAAIGISRSLNLDWEDIKKALKNVKLTSMRLEIMTTPQGVKIINDSYNANPTSMTAAIKVLAQLPGRRRIAVLGDMYELGIYEEQGHKAMGQTAFNENIDLIVAVGKLGKLIGMGAIEAGMVEEKVVFANTNEHALRVLVNFLEPDDIVLVKGSRGMKMEGIVQGLMG